MNPNEKPRGRGRGRARGNVLLQSAEQGANAEVGGGGAMRGRGFRGSDAGRGAMPPESVPPTQALQPRVQNFSPRERPPRPGTGERRGGPSGSRFGTAGRGGRGRANQLLQSLIRTRPAGYDEKKGIKGTPVKVSSNYFKLMTHPKWTIYQYRVDMSPEEERTAVRRLLLKDHKKILKGYIFDGTVMYTPFRLNPDPMTLCSKKSDGTIMNITIKHVGEVGYGDYVYLQVYNIIMRKCYSTLKLQLLGRDFFDPEGKIDIREHRIQIWPGYKTTIAQHDDGILMVAEITHKVIRTDTVLDNLLSARQQFGESYRKMFCKEIIGQVVLTVYNNKTYRVDDIEWKKNPGSTFPRNGEEVSYVQYYQEKYNIRITDTTQPLIVSLAKQKDLRRGCTETFYLIPELCRMTGLSDKMRGDFRLMKALSNHTRVAPDARTQKLLAFNKRLLTSKECCEELKEWDMSLNQNLVEFNGRQLAIEDIISGPQGTKKYSAGETNDGWTKELRRFPMINTAKVTSWVVITIQKLRKDTESFLHMMIEAAGGMKWSLPTPVIYDIPNDSVATYMSEIEKILSQRTPSILMCVTLTSKSELYNAIKKKCCVDRAIPTQIVVAKSIQHKSAFSIATKIIIQMNCKMGGAPWIVNVPLSGLMVIGYDVCHSPKDRKRSYGAMVASLDRFQTKYFNCVSQHSNGEELAHEFCINIKKALQKYCGINGSLPSHIVIYRDGVGEGQIPYVFNHEIEVIKKALEEMYGGPKYKLQFTIVSKRINTRFFVNNRNPRPGTVVDSVVTSPERYDFFLVSQAVRDGTVAPTSYNILMDTTKLSPDQSQLLAYKMCHMYYNFSGQVRVPAPCQYAHKLAFLVSQNIQQPPHQSLNEALFFL